MIAYELFAGRRPFLMPGFSPVDAIQSIANGEPSLLSSVDQQYRGDLETIVAKALEKDIRHRYASVAHLASDLQRHLRHEPILARKPNLRYRLGKYVRRNKALVTGASLVCIALVAGIIGTSWQATKARRTADSAEERLAQSLVAQGDVLLNAGKAEEARVHFVEAAQHLERLGKSSFPARLGIWEAETRSPHPLKVWRAHSDSVKLVAISNNGIEAVSVGTDKAVIVWDLVLQERIAQYFCSDLPESVVISPLDRMVAAMGRDGVVTVWDRRSETPVYSSPLPARPMPRTLQLSPDGNTLVWCTSTRQLVAWRQGEIEATSLPIAPENIRDVAFTVDNTVVIVTESNALHHLKLGETASYWQLLLAGSPNQRDIIASPDGRRLCIHSNGAISELTAAGPRLLKKVGDRGVQIAISNEGTLAIYAPTLVLNVTDLRTPAFTTSFSIPSPWASKLSGDGSTLVVGREDGTLALFPTQPRHLIHHLSSLGGAMQKIAAHPQLPLLVSVNQDGLASVWHTQTGRCISSVQLQDPVEFLALLPGTMTAVALTNKGRVTKFEVDAMRSSVTSDRVAALPAGLLGNQLIVGGDKGSLAVVDLTTMKASSLPGSANINALTVVHDSKLLAADDSGVLYSWQNLAEPPVRSPTKLGRLEVISWQKERTFIAVDARHSLIAFEIDPAEGLNALRVLNQSANNLVRLYGGANVTVTAAQSLQVWGDSQHTVARTIHSPPAVPEAIAALASGGFATANTDGTITLYGIPTLTTSIGKPASPPSLNGPNTALLESCKSFSRAGLHRLALAAHARAGSNISEDAADAALASRQALGMTVAARELQKAPIAGASPSDRLRKMLCQAP